MAAFADMAAAETFARASIADGTNINAYAGRTYIGEICVFYQKKTVFADYAVPAVGGWQSTIDDGVVEEPEPPPPPPEDETQTQSSRRSRG